MSGLEFVNFSNSDTLHYDIDGDNICEIFINNRGVGMAVLSPVDNGDTIFTHSASSVGELYVDSLYVGDVNNNGILDMVIKYGIDFYQADSGLSIYEAITSNHKLSFKLIFLSNNDAQLLDIDNNGQWEVVERNVFILPMDETVYDMYYWAYIYSYDGSEYTINNEAYITSIQSIADEKRNMLDRLIVNLDNRSECKLIEEIYMYGASVLASEFAKLDTASVIYRFNQYGEIFKRLSDYNDYNIWPESIEPYDFFKSMTDELVDLIRSHVYRLRKSVQ